MKAMVDDAEEEFSLGLLKGGEEGGAGEGEDGGDGRDGGDEGGEDDGEVSTLEQAKRRIVELEKEVSGLRLRLAARSPGDVEE